MGKQSLLYVVTKIIINKWIIPMFKGDNVAYHYNSQIKISLLFTLSCLIIIYNVWYNISPEYCTPHSRGFCFARHVTKSLINILNLNAVVLLLIF